MILKKFLIRLNNFFLFFGINILKIYNLRYIPGFFRDIFKFLNKGGKIDFISPELGDHKKKSAELGIYFYQDLLVAKYIHEIKPFKHVDIGSRVDGFISNI